MEGGREGAGGTFGCGDRDGGAEPTLKQEKTTVNLPCLALPLPLPSPKKESLARSLRWAVRLARCPEC